MYSCHPDKEPTIKLFFFLFDTTVRPRLIAPLGLKIFHLHLRFTFKERWNHFIIIWDLKILTFINGNFLKAGLLLRGSTVIVFLLHFRLWGEDLFITFIYKWRGGNNMILLRWFTGPRPPPSATRNFSYIFIPSVVRIFFIWFFRYAIVRKIAF